MIVRMPQPGRRVGVVGTGFGARHSVTEVARRPDWTLGRMLTWRALDRVGGVPDGSLARLAEDALPWTSRRRCRAT